MAKSHTHRPETRAPAEAREALARDVRRADPSAFLVPARILRRVIREKIEVPGLGISLPHRKTFVLSRDELFRIVDRSELGLGSDAAPPDPVLLISEPSEEAFLYLAPAELRRRTWRLVYHAKIHAVFARRIAMGRYPQSAILARIDRIGQTAFDEIRAVLKQEELLLPPRTDLTIYVEFAAFFLDTFHFAPHLLPHYFPGIADPERVRRLLAEDVEEAELLSAVRLPGAPEPGAVDLSHEEKRWNEASHAARAEPEPRPSARRFRRQRRRGIRAAKAGNQVRAAIFFRRAANRDPHGDGEAERARAVDQIEKLLGRLAKALDIPSADLPAWREGLLGLLIRTGAKVWSREARALYDLQKVCVDHERGVFTIDPVEWALSLGRRPIRRWLPSEREVLENRHLRSAERRLPYLRLPPETHARFQPVLRHAVQAAEHRLRETFRPRIPAVFREVGLTPTNLPERMALDKLTEELLDEITARGRLRMGDLRDAISRNQLKLPDVRNPFAVLTRDPLLRADRKLAVSLDGVYRRAEFYLRWLQRLSALALGTGLGRLFVRYLAIPFGGAFVALEGLQHIVNPIVEHVTGSSDEAVHLAALPRVAGLGLFFLLLLHLPVFRRAVWEVLRVVFRGFRLVFYTVPAFLIRLPVVARLLESRPFLFAVRFLVKPAAYAAILFLLMRLFGSDAPGSWRDVLVAFFGLDILVNVPAGRRLEEITYDRLARNLHRFRVRVLSGLYQLVVGVFRRFLDAMDRILYSIDEWLRFRSGESRISLVVKPLVGVVWFLVSYIIRIYTTVLIEPQVNPIKHFPVVTVSHKLMLPFAVTLTKLLATPLAPLGAVVANAIAGTTVLLLPGVFGFLVWELKENWKLFATNRPPSLRPVLIGHHGETMLRLMKPGFHSGTLPRLYARLRRAERKAWQTGSERRIRKLTNDLHHVEEAVRRFIVRDFLPLLARSAGTDFRVSEIRMGSNVLRVRIARAGSASETMTITFEEQSGWLLATVADPGWLPELTGEERAGTRNALAGLYKRAGVEIVREQVRAALGPKLRAWDVSDRGLLIWPGEAWDREVVYPLDGPTRLCPETPAGAVPNGFTPIAPEAVLFAESPLTWPDWVRAWPEDGEPRPRPLLPDVHLLP